MPRVSGARSGLWEAGDYLEPTAIPPGMTKWPYVRVAADNDVDTAQGGSVRQMARLVGLIGTGQVLDTASCTEMTTRLGSAATGVDQPWIDRPSPRLIPHAAIVGNKLGLGPLKSGGSVRSEVTLLNGPVAADRKYVVAWQNMLGLSPVTFSDVATVIRDTITAFEA